MNVKKLLSDIVAAINRWQNRKRCERCD